MIAKTDGGYVQTTIDSSPTLDTSTLDTTKETTKAVIEPTKSVETPTLGVSDIVPSQQPIIGEKSWWQRLMEFFKSGSK